MSAQGPAHGWSRRDRRKAWGSMGTSCLFSCLSLIEWMWYDFCFTVQRHKDDISEFIFVPFVLNLCELCV